MLADKEPYLVKDKFYTNIEFVKDLITYVIIIEDRLLSIYGHPFPIGEKPDLNKFFKSHEGDGVASLKIPRFPDNL